MVEYAAVQCRVRHGYVVWTAMSEDRVLHLPTGEVISIIRTGPETEGKVFEFEAVLPSGLSGPPSLPSFLEAPAPQ
jgi:hypothetical protein